MMLLGFAGLGFAFRQRPRSSGFETVDQHAELVVSADLAARKRARHWILVADRGRPERVGPIGAPEPGTEAAASVDPGPCDWRLGLGEYKYIDLGSSTVRFAGVPDNIAEVASERINQRYQAVTLGLNYKLN
jgi:hypothetical protein